jgi:hypothetical protein
VITLTDEVGRRPPPGGESLVSHTGGALLVETARRSGLDRALSRLLEPWRKPLAIHDPGKIVRAGPVARRKDRLPQHQLRIRGDQHQALDSQLNRGVLTMIIWHPTVRGSPTFPQVSAQMHVYFSRRSSYDVLAAMSSRRCAHRTWRRPALEQVAAGGIGDRHWRIRPTRSMQLHLKDDDDHAKSAVDQTDE